LATGLSGQPPRVPPVPTGVGLWSLAANCMPADIFALASAICWSSVRVECYFTHPSRGYIPVGTAFSPPLRTPLPRRPIPRLYCSGGAPSSFAAPGVVGQRRQEGKWDEREGEEGLRRERREERERKKRGERRGRERRERRERSGRGGRGEERV